FTRACNRMEAPYLPASGGIHTDDVIDSTAGADHHHAFRHERPANHAAPGLVIPHRMFPDDASRVDVERNELHVRCWDVHAIAIEGEASFPTRGRSARQTARILPQQIAGGGIERLHD